MIMGGFCKQYYARDGRDLINQRNLHLNQEGPLFLDPLDS